MKIKIKPEQIKNLKTRSIDVVLNNIVAQVKDCRRDEALAIDQIGRELLKEEMAYLQSLIVVLNRERKKIK